MNKETLQEYNTRLTENNTSLDDILTTINDLPEGTGDDKVYNGTTLFEGEASTGNITLNEDVSDFKFIEIFFRCNASYYNSIKIHQPNGKKAVLTVVECNDSDNYFMNFKSKNISISGNTITNQYFGEINFKMSTKSIYASTRTNSIYIVRVIGYK